MTWFVMRAKRVENDIKAKKLKVSDCKTLKENKEAVFSFDREESLNGRKVGTRYSQLVTLHYLCQFAKAKPFKKITKNDVVAFLEQVRTRGFQDERYRARFKRNVEKEIANSTLNLHKHVVRKFLSFVHGADKHSYPECVAWINVRTICGKGKMAEDMLTPKEIETMVAATENPRDRALISLMAESGARLGEIITARIRDVRFTERGFTLTVDGKTGKRTIPLYVSEADLKNWVNNFHPFKNYGDAPLFTSYTVKKKRTNLKHEGVRRIVRMAAARAGTQKNVHPHLFRHTRATELARLGWTEPMLKRFFGWHKTSNMPSLYVHLAQTDIEDKYYEMYGVAPSKSKPAPKTITNALKCPACNTTNPTGYVFCFKCNQPLGHGAENRTRAYGLLDQIVADEKLRQEFNTLLERAYKRKHIT